MSRNRTVQEHKALPRGWRWKDGAYRYQVPARLRPLWDNKSEFKLGVTLPEAYREWAKRLPDEAAINTLHELFLHYRVKVLSQKKESTGDGQYAILDKLDQVFGEMPVSAIRRTHAVQYYERRTAKTAAKREIEVLRHCMTKAVDWGLVDQNLLMGIRMEGAKRDVMPPTDEQITAVLRLERDRKPAKGTLVIQGYIRLKLLTGMRRTDMLSLTTDCLQLNGIHLGTSKTGAKVIIGWSEALRAAVGYCWDAKPVPEAPNLFCTRMGKTYLNSKMKANGFESMWQRVMAKLPEDIHFQERSLRNRAGDDAQSLEHAQALLTHVDSRTTKIYRTKAEVVRPIR